MQTLFIPGNEVQVGWFNIMYMFTYYLNGLHAHKTLNSCTMKKTLEHDQISTVQRIQSLCTLYFIQTHALMCLYGFGVFVLLLGKHPRVAFNWGPLKGCDHMDVSTIVSMLLHSATVYSHRRRVIRLTSVSNSSNLILLQPAERTTLSRDKQDICIYTAALFYEAKLTRQLTVGIQ